MWESKARRKVSWKCHFCRSLPDNVNCSQVITLLLLSMIKQLQITVGKRSFSMGKIYRVTKDQIYNNKLHQAILNIVNAWLHRRHYFYTFFKFAQVFSWMPSVFKYGVVCKLKLVQFGFCFIFTILNLHNCFVGKFDL